MQFVSAPVPIMAAVTAAATKGAPTVRPANYDCTAASHISFASSKVQPAFGTI